MKYRRFGKLDWMISEISLGVLRLDEVVEEPCERNDRERIEAIRYAIDRGVNYINLGYPFYFEEPETAGAYVKEALGGGYRDKVKAAVNIPANEALSQRDLDNAVDRQVGFFGLDKADFCVIDGVDRTTWNTLKSVEIASWAPRVADVGKAEHVAIAFHDDAHYLKEICSAYPDWAFIQIELSILDYTHHPGVGAFTFSKELDCAVIATDITKAGRLLKNVPKEVGEIVDKSRLKMEREALYLSWALSHEEVSSVQLSVQSELRNIESAKKYLSHVEQFDSNDFGVWEKLAAAQIREAYYAKRDYQCTACRCCMPCPSGIDAPRIVELINNEKMFSDQKISEFQYNMENHQNTQCAQCGVCDKHCPKRIPLQKIVSGAYEKYRQNSPLPARSLVGFDR